MIHLKSQHIKYTKIPPISSLMSRSPTPTGHQGNPTLKQILKAGDTLLKPPKPLPSNPPELLPRLRACSKALPKEWKHSVPEWSEDDEMDHVGDNGGLEISEERKKKRRDELVFVVGKRCFAMANAMQTWLEKEFWPKEQRGGLEDKDCKVQNSSQPDVC